MQWLVGEKLREILEGVLQAEATLQEAKEAEAEDTITAISYAYINAEVDAPTRTLVIKTGNYFFGGERDEVRRGRLGEWAIVWERNDVGITTGEDFMPENLRTWLLEHTRAYVAEDREDHEDGEHYYGDEHYWDIYPW